MDILSQFLRANREKELRIDCLGDAMIDEYYCVNVNRISPEFPMPIMQSTHGKCVTRPGGVANVVHQFKHFNVYSILHCFPDKLAEEVLLQHGIVRSDIDFNFNAQLPVKRRYLDNGVQIIRHDIEVPLCGLNANQIEHFLDDMAEYIESLERPDVVVLSDYDKGFFSDNFHLSDFYSDTLTIVDPKHGPLDKWVGCSIFKPNAKEAYELSGLSDWQDQAKFFRKELGCKSVVITYGGEKVVGIDGNEFFSYSPTKTVNVESVVGAGDCFCAFFAMAVGHKFSVPEAAEIAWNAGSKYVQGKMNRPITPAEIAADGIVEPEDLANRDFKLVFANGCFDLGLTAAHVEVIEQAKKYGDKLVVALNSDESVSRIKGQGRPIMSLKERSKIVASMKGVDFVTYFEEDTPLEIIKKIKPEVIVKGGDYKREDVVGFGFADVEIIKHMKTTSTTKKLEKVGKILLDDTI